jgi:acyl-CoA oxidase
MLTPKFWALHTDPIWNMDGAAGTLCTVQLNLCVGTLLTFAKGRKDIDLLVDDLLRFSVS